LPGLGNEDPKRDFDFGFPISDFRIKDKNLPPRFKGEGDGHSEFQVRLCPKGKTPKSKQLWSAYHTPEFISVGRSSVGIF